MAENLDIKVITSNGSPAQYEKIVVAHNTSTGLKEKSFTTNSDGVIKTGIKNPNILDRFLIH